MGESELDKSKAIALAELLGLEVKLNSETPGVFIDGKEASYKDIFPELERLEEDKCIVLMQDQAIGYHSDWDYPVMIRIADKDGELPPLENPSQYKGILELYFYDLHMTEDEWKKSNLVKYNIFSKCQARHLFSFVEQHRKADSFVIHCGAGVSRSPAIAIGVAKHLGDNDLANRIMNDDKYFLNQHVLTIINEELNNLQK
ncbi:hypothetical protein [Bacillus sp. NPDC094106]|uniref:hypothetical protein n=1 Tax=Bacillus sp. NPDC094106 TaxID=3363949 RepID=UPI00381FFA4E